MSDCNVKQENCYQVNMSTVDCVTSRRDGKQCTKTMCQLQGYQMLVNANIVKWSAENAGSTPVNQIVIK